MDFDWSQYQSDDISKTDAAESLEDPFSIRFIPDSGSVAEKSRFFCLGRTLSGKGLFSVYNSNGKSIKVIFVRPMSDDETYVYERKLKEAL